MNSKTGKRFSGVPLILSLAILTCLGVRAQVAYGPRYEQEHDWTNNGYVVISNEQEGVLIALADSDSGSKKYPISLKLLNARLEKVWEDTVRVPHRYFLKSYFYGEKKTYLMFQNDNRDKVMVLRIDALNHKIDEFESKEIAKLDITEFEVLKNTVVIGGYFDNRPVVFAYDLEQNQVRTLRNLYQNNSKLAEVKLNKDSVTFNVLATVRDARREQTIMVNTYDYAGNAIRDYQLIKKPDYQLVNGFSSSINSIEQVVVGIYAYKTSHAASGIYVNHIDRTGRQTMNYYNFGALPRFLDYMGERQAKKQRKRALSMKKAGKELRYKSELMPRELIEKDDKFVFTGEFYRVHTPIRTNNELNQWDWWNRRRFDNLYGPSGNFNNNREREKNNHFTHAYMLVMNQDGSILWDDSMEIDVKTSGIPHKLGRFQWMGEKGAYAYYHNGELFLKLMDGSGENEMSTSELALKNEGDKIRVEKEAGLGSVRWYGNHFLVYGIHHIRPKDRSKPLRKVFFINKVSCEF